MTATVLVALRGRLIVSCQAYPGEPMRDPEIMGAIAQSVVAGGASAIRAQGLADIAAIRRRTSVPIIGLVKVGRSPAMTITPTVADVRVVAASEADVIAVDGTVRPRPDGSALVDSVNVIHAAGKLVMADCATVADARHSVAAGADCVGTTLAGYTHDRAVTVGPDLDLLSRLVASIGVPVIAEGRVRTPMDAAACLDAGAHAVVVGTAITHPTEITRGFVGAIARRGADLSAR